MPGPALKSPLLRREELAAGEQEISLDFISNSGRAGPHLEVQSTQPTPAEGNRSSHLTSQQEIVQPRL